MVVTDTQPETPPTSELLARAKAGETEAFCQLVTEHERRLVGQAFALCGEQAAAEDLAQQTLIEAWESLARFDGSCRFSTWLYAILLHRYYKWLRRARSRPIPLSLLPAADADREAERLLEVPETASGPADVLLQKEQSAQWRRCLDALPDPHRQVVLLRFFEEASLGEIATLLHCSVGTVKSRLHHALDKLRRLTHCVNLFKSRRDT